jgi:hypothetical protein
MCVDYRHDSVIRRFLRSKRRKLYVESTFVRLNVAYCTDSAIFQIFTELYIKILYKKLFSSGKLSESRLSECRASLEGEFTRTSRMNWVKFCVANLKVILFSICQFREKNGLMKTILYLGV